MWLLELFREMPKLNLIVKDEHAQYFVLYAQIYKQKKISFFLRNKFAWS